MFTRLYDIIYDTFLEASGTSPSWNLEDVSLLLTYIVMGLIFYAMIKFVVYFFTLPSKLL